MPWWGRSADRGGATTLPGAEPRQRARERARLVADADAGEGRGDVDLGLDVVADGRGDVAELVDLGRDVVDLQRGVDAGQVRGDLVVVLVHGLQVANHGLVRRREAEAEGRVDEELDVVDAQLARLDVALLEELRDRLRHRHGVRAGDDVVGGQHADDRRLADDEGRVVVDEDQLGALEDGDQADDLLAPEGLDRADRGRVGEDLERERLGLRGAVVLLTHQLRVEGRRDRVHVEALGALAGLAAAGADRRQVVGDAEDAQDDVHVDLAAVLEAVDRADHRDLVVRVGEAEVGHDLAHEGTELDRLVLAVADLLEELGHRDVLLRRVLDDGLVDRPVDEREAGREADLARVDHGDQALADGDGEGDDVVDQGHEADGLVAGRVSGVHAVSFLIVL